MVCNIACVCVYVRLFVGWQGARLKAKGDVCLVLSTLYMHQRRDVEANNQRI